MLNLFKSFVACLCLAAAPALAQTYELVDLGTLGGSYSGATCIDEDGTIGGWATNTAGYKLPVLWIDGVDEVLPVGDGEPGTLLAGFRLIPPKGRSFDRNRKPSFFSASPALIAHLADLSESELEDLLEAGRDPGEVASVASFFVSRVDSAVDGRLAALARSPMRVMRLPGRCRIRKRTGGVRRNQRRKR